MKRQLGKFGEIKRNCHKVKAQLDGILANHSPDISMFDVPPPVQSKGIEAYKKTWILLCS
jgi:ketosteroid isomerase-like protein